jgi:hypothetical protein
MFVKIAAVLFSGKGRFVAIRATVACVNHATRIYAGLALRSLNVKVAGL